MTRQRSYADARAGQQLYAVLTACKRPQTLWDKLSTGHYDWIGVRANGRYVLGRPRLASLSVGARVVSDDPGSPIRSSGIWQVRLYVGGVLAAEELVVRRLPKLL